LPTKALNRTLTGFLIAAILLVALFFCLRIWKVQTWLVNRFLARVEKKYEGRLTVGKVLIRWPHRLEFDDLLILDPLNDTLFYSPSIRLSVNKLDLDRNHLNFGRVVIENPVIQLRQLPSGQMNYELLLEAMKSTDSTGSSKPFSLAANQFILRKGAFQYRKFGSLNKPGMVNWDDLFLKDIEIAIKHFELDGSTVNAGIDLISFTEQSGFALNKLTADLVIDSTGIHTRNMVLLTGNSRIESARAQATDIWNQQVSMDKIRLDVVLGRNTYLSPVDFNLLSGINTGLTTPFEISGLFNGSPTNARLLNASLNWPNLFSFEGDLLYDFPGNVSETFIDLKTRSLVLQVSKLFENVLSGQIPGFDLSANPALKNLNTYLRNLDSVEYSGVFTGTIENFLATGNWNVDGSEFSTNLQVNKNSPVKGYNFKGSVSAADFNPDVWIKKPTGISGVEFNVNVDGTWDGNKEVTALLIGRINQFALNGYIFQDLQIDGRATGKKFTGSLILKDPSADLDLSGSFDFGQAKPVLDFNLLINHADLYALSLVKNDTVALLKVDMHGSFTGKEIDDMDGEIKVRNSSYTNSRGILPITEMTLSSIPELGHRKIIFASDYVDARLVGNVHLDDLTAQVQSLLARFIPALTKTQPIRADHLNDFAFNIQIKNSSPVTRVLFPGFQCKDNTRLGGSYTAVDQTISIEGISPQFVTAGGQFTGFDMRIESSGDSLILVGTVNKIQLDRNTVFEKINLGASLSENQMNAVLNWNTNGTTGPRGRIGCAGLMSQKEDGKLRGEFNFPVSEMIFSDSVWRIDPFQIAIDREKVEIDHFMANHNGENLGIKGSVSLNPADTLFIGFNNVNLSSFGPLIGSEDFRLNGRMTGEARLYDMRNKGMFLTEVRIDSLSVNERPLGLATLSSRSAGSGEPVLMDLLIQRGSIKTLQLNGQYNPVTDSLSFNLVVDKLRMDLANPFVNDELLDVKGLATGKMKISGTPKDPLVYGNIMMQKASFIVNYLNTRFYFTHNVVITPDAFSVTNMDVQDDEGNHAHLTGAVRHNKFNDIRLDFNMDFKDFVLINEVESRNEGYWGRGYGTGVASITGPLRSLMIDVSAKSSPKTKFFIPVYTTDEARMMDFVTYIGKPLEEVDGDLLDFSGEGIKGYEVNLYGATVNIDLEVTPDADVQLIFDSKVGNVIHAKGSGNLRIFVPPTSLWTLDGDYTIEQGDYQFTLQNMPVKRLQIEPGATLKWTGDVSNAQLDIDAVYRTKASLYDLLQDESNPDLAQRLPVECHLLMTGFLETPVLDFNIVLPPTSNDIARTQLQNLTKEELYKQVISLLILNRFTPLQGTGSGTAKGYENVGLSTTTELLSNQLNYWISQISKDFDVGFNYRPGDQLTSDEVEVALSKQFLNNRMTINVNGNYDVRPTTTNTNQLVGDVEVEYKIKQSGKLRVKAFTRANDHLLYEYAPYTQGVGLFFREEFDTFGSLARKYRDKWFRK
jgi:hypothetical protein